MTFGIDPKEEYQVLDQPEDMIRIRMICTILETCGAYFVSTSSKAKLKYYLAYFQVSFHQFMCFLTDIKKYWMLL